MVVPPPPAARWLIKDRDRTAEERLIRQLGVPSLVAAVLAQRGFTDPETAHRFLNPRLDDLHSPRLLPDYEPAVKAILSAKERGETIFIHGDYDVDGVTSASILSRFLQVIGCKVITHVPHRMREGYGIHATAVESAIAQGAKLFLTCDCGSGAIEQIARAREAGMATVVTDHHTIGAVPPGADAFINPHRDDSEYPFAELSGAGVAFKLCEGLTEEVGFKKEQYYRAFLDLAALGTIADVMPLQGENRIIAKFGLERLGDTKKVGIKALKQAAQMKVDEGQPLRAYHVGFVLGPRLNAAGRIDDAALALKLLLTNDAAEASEIAGFIEEVNMARRAEQDRILEEAVQQVVDRGAQEKNVILVGARGWHAGVVGIVAGRLVEMFHRPTFVLTIDDEGVCKGSARTIPNFHLADAIRAFPDLFLSGGGHAMAAGCSFHESNFATIETTLHQYAAERLTPEDFIPAVQIDIEVDPSEVTLKAAEELAKLEPFGCENPTPVFAAKGIRVSQVMPTKNPAHVRLSLRHGSSSTFPGVAFGIGERFAQTGAGAEIDVIFQPNVDEWKGMRQLKWQIKDFAPVV